MPPSLEPPTSTPSGEPSPSTPTNAEALLSRRGSGRGGDDGVGGGGGGGGSSPSSTPWIAIGVIVCFLILFALLVCWGTKRRRTASNARKERLERDKRRYEIEMRSLGRQDCVGPPPDYVVTMLEQPEPVPAHLRQGDSRERLVP